MISFFKTVFTFLITYKEFTGALLIIAAYAWLGSSYLKVKYEAQIAGFKAQIAIQTGRTKEEL